MKGDINMQERSLGRVTSSRVAPSSANTFYFWVAEDAEVNLLDFVSVENIDNTRSIGIIKDLTYFTEADNHLTNYISSDFGDVEADPPSNILGTCIAKVDILGNTGRNSQYSRTGRTPIWYPPKNFSRVKFATSEEINIALGISVIQEEDIIPSGLIVDSRDTVKPLFYDKRYLLGPEAGHLNVTGISGLATKTSYAMFLLWCIFQRKENDTCAIVFNVKQRDLLYIDREANDLDQTDMKLYEALGIEDIHPFKEVTYLLPKNKRSEMKEKSTNDSNCKEYSFPLEKVKDEIELLFSEVSDPQYTIASICEWIKGKKGNINSWQELKEYEQYPKDVVGSSNANAVIGRFKRHLSRLTSNKDIFVERQSTTDCYLGEFIADRLAPGKIFVVDIQPLEKEPEIQGFVVGDVINRVLNKISTSSGDRSQNIIFYVDELNRYVPDKPGEPSALAHKLIELARVGRAEKISLFGAEQFMSEVNHQVYDNCANKVIGRTGAMELSRQCYSFLDNEIKLFATRLQPGEMIVSNPLLSQPLRIIFPKPPFLRQS